MRLEEAYKSVQDSVQKNASTQTKRLQLVYRVGGVPQDGGVAS